MALLIRTYFVLLRNRIVEERRNTVKQCVGIQKNVDIVWLSLSLFTYVSGYGKNNKDFRFGCVRPRF